MHIGGKALALVAAIATFAVVLFAVELPIAFAQAPAATTPAFHTTAEVPAQPPAASLIITGKEASTWADRGGSGASIVQIAGPLSIQIDKTTLTARDAVVWIEAVRGAAARPGDEQVTVALLGDAKVQRPELTRSADRLLVTARVNGAIRIAADDRQPRDLSGSATFKAAVTLREQSEAVGAAQQNQAVDLPTPPAPGVTATPPHAATTRPAAAAAAGVTTRPAAAPVIYRAADISNVTAGNGKMALALGGRDGVVLSREGEDGTVMEMQAQRAVVFTTLTGLRDMTDMQNVRRIEEAITAAYLEGDVRVTITSPNDQVAEQRLEANRVYYDFTTDRAVLTEAVLHTVDVARNIPLIVRAETLRQLSDREYRATGTELSTSSFAVPSYGLRAERAYVRQVDTGDTRYGTRTYFQANDVTLRTFGVPFFYLPEVGGNVTDRGGALRGLSFGQSENFGTSVETKWGFFETIGRIPPEQIDATYSLDYYSERGPAFGFDAEYGGGFVSKTTKQAWNFEGEFKSYFVPHDTGVDDLGRDRAPVVPPQDFRGRVEWEHQHFFPEYWQLQIRAGWMSDATFREEWFQEEFDEDLTLESSLYLKRQENNEAITFLATVEPNDLVTSAEYQQEQFEVERLPEFGYHRIGESFADDRLTFYSDNTVGRYRFNPSEADLQEQGFRFSKDVRPGRPSLGLVGVSGLDGPPNVTDDWTFRGDFRQEVDFPLAIGQFKVVPYVMGRYTGYTDSPDGDNINRGLVGTGVRVNTQFWQVNNRAKSELFDINRTRHIIEPEVHAFTSVSNIDPNELWIYDEHVDNINDITAVQLALRQRWQTKRGAPGRQRSVDFLRFNVEANFFGNKPDDVDLAPLGFRGLMYPSIPEASIPRNSINADTLWRVSDTTILLGDVQYNLDEDTLATAGIGLVARRDTRVAYFLGLRYIEQLDSNIGTIALSYELTTRYTIGLRQSYDFGDSGNVYSSISLQRRFDRFLMMASIYNNSTDDNKGFSIGFFPEGFAGASTDTLQRAFGGQ